MKSSTLAYVWGRCEFNGWFIVAMQVATTVSCLSTLPALPRALDNASFLTNSWNAEMSKCMVSSSSPSVPSGMSCTALGSGIAYLLDGILVVVDAVYVHEHFHLPNHLPAHFTNDETFPLNVEDAPGVSVCTGTPQKGSPQKL